MIDIKKWWLYLFYISFAFFVISVIKSYQGDLISTIVFGITFLYYLSLFYFGYYKKKGWMLGFSIVLLGISFAINLINLSAYLILGKNHFYVKGIIIAINASIRILGLPIVIMSNLTSALFFYLTIRLKKLCKSTS